jgi:hypothetical protein
MKIEVFSNLSATEDKERKERKRQRGREKKENNVV